MYNQFTTDSLGEGYKLASWHLQYIGVIPSKQMHGVGSALIKHVEDEVASSSSRSQRFCLETESEGAVCTIHSATVHDRTDFMLLAGIL